jgi:hypothetical protein
MMRWLTLVSGQILISASIIVLAVVYSLAATAEPRSFRCQQPLPEFTLGEKSNPTDEQVTRLCQCIWDNLGTWEKRVAVALSKNESPTEPLPSPELNKYAFINRFGEAYTKCGGYDF